MYSIQRTKGKWETTGFKKLDAACGQKVGKIERRAKMLLLIAGVLLLFFYLPASFPTEEDKKYSGRGVSLPYEG